MKNKKGVIYKRKQEILRELHENKKVLVDDLAKALHVSPITIRRDLDEFQAEGIVERFYGGASLVEGALAEDPSEQDSSDQNQSCKESIAREYFKVSCLRSGAILIYISPRHSGL